MATPFSVTQIVRDAFSELKRIRSRPTGGPPTRAGAEELAAILRPRPGEAEPGGIADTVFTQWGATTIARMAIYGSAQQHQVGFARQAVAAPPSVVVMDARGNPLAQVPVAFRIGGGGGTVSPARERTGRNGAATMTSWILGDRGDNGLIAVAGNVTLVFTATAVTAAVAVSPTTQTGGAGAPARHAPTVRLTDHAGRPVANAVVTFTVTAGGGLVRQPQPRSDANGRASCELWTLGSAPGTNAVEATAGPFIVQFEATTV